jgi:hypothetical protein
VRIADRGMQSHTEMPLPLFLLFACTDMPHPRDTERGGAETDFEQEIAETSEKGFQHFQDNAALRPNAGGLITRGHSESSPAIYCWVNVF